MKKGLEDGRKVGNDQKLKNVGGLLLVSTGGLILISVEAFLNKVRGCGVGIHALTQSVADGTDIVKRENARRLLDNFNTQLFFRVNDPETSRYVASKAGSRKVFTRIFAGGAFSGREMREPVLDTASALELPDRVFYLFTQSNGKHSSYRGRTVNVSSVPLRVRYDSAEVSSPGISRVNQIRTSS